MSNYTETDLAKLRVMHSQDEIIEYFDVDEEDKQCLKRFERILNYMRNCYCFYTDPTNGYLDINETIYYLSQVIFNENDTL